MATVMVTVEDTIRDRQVKVQLDTQSSCKNALLDIIHALSLPKRGSLGRKVPYRLFNATTNKRLLGKKPLSHYGITEGSALRLRSSRRGKAVTDALDELLEEILEEVAEELWDKALKRRVKRALRRIRRTDTTGPIIDKFVAAIESPNAAAALVAVGTAASISPVILIGAAATVLVVGGIAISQSSRPVPPTIDSGEFESESNIDDDEFLALGGDDDTVEEQDTDGDGLLDAEEDEIGTDRRRVDTDSDELWDGDEVNELDTDPLDDDTDGDGYSDGEEVLDLGTDPLDPDDPGEDEVTEPPPREDTAPEDTDGDGLLDDEEDEIGTNKRQPDTDRDSIQDGEEVLELGTDPLDDDTDGDGYSDGEEVLNLGTDPLDPDDPCSPNMAYLNDVTIPDGTVLEPGESFVKTWEIRNNGSCTWNDDYLLVFVDGASLSDTDAVSIGSAVSPGGVTRVSVQMNAPESPGSYRSTWQMLDDNGNLFGDQPYVSIEVAEIEVPGPGGGTISYGQTRSGTLSQGAYDEWTFSGSSGDTVAISLNSSAFDTYLELYNPSGSLIAYDDDSGSDYNSLISGYRLQSSGTFSIVVIAFSDEESGSYSLSLERVEPVPEPGGGAISYGQTRSGTLSQGAYDEWTFSGSSGDTIAISLNSSAFDTFLELYDPSGSLIAYDDDSGSSSTNALISGYQLQSSGTFTIVVSAFSDDESGSYSLSLERVETSSLSAPSGVSVEFESYSEAYLPTIYWNNVSGASWYEIWVLARGASEYVSLGAASGSPFVSSTGWSNESFPLTFAICACNNDTCSEYTYYEIATPFRID